jgi:UDP-N-acetylmuramoyl-L-alanyl-D-glutamate--2,6-diaminopimelate ligase
MITLSHLLDILPDERIQQLSDAVLHIAIVDVTADSRAVRPGSLFVAVPGARSDGHRYIATAVKQGAAAVIGTRPAAALCSDGIDVPAAVPYIQVGDSRRALALACAAVQGFPSRQLAIAGVTGTDGKTTTHADRGDSEGGHPHAADTPAGRVGVITTVSARIGGAEIDTGFHVTTPDAPEVQRFLRQMVDAGCTYAVVESTSHGLHQGRVAAVDFDIAAVTNITHEHLDYHGTRDAYVAAKALLFRSLYRSPAKPGIAALRRAQRR